MLGRIDFDAVNSAALSSLSGLLSGWLPDGRRRGHEWVARNPTRSDRRAGSFSVNMDTGQWADFATDEAGGDPVSLYAYLHDLSQTDAARQLADELGMGNAGMNMHNDRAAFTPRAERPAEWVPILPVPDAVEEPTKARLATLAPAGHAFSSVWHYLDADGRLLNLIARYDATSGDGGKQFLPLSFCSGPNGASDWRLKALPTPRPLYRLDALAARSGAPVLVVEGEKAADAAAKLFPSHVVTTSSGGAKAAGAADWSAICGRSVTIWPDNDEAGAEHAKKVEQACEAAGARGVRVIALPSSLPKKWDLADPLPAGVSLDDLAKLLNGPTVPREAPLPLFPELPAPEPFPMDCLGPVLSGAARAIVGKIQVPEAIAAQSVLAAASLVAQGRADVRLPYGQVRPLSLFLVTLAGSGDRKSTADNEALWPIRRREKALKEEFDAALKEWAIEHAAWSAQRKKLEGDKKLDIHAQKDELRALGDEPERPLFPFITAPDPTFEGLAKAMPNALPALGIFTAEGGQFIGGHGMSQDNRLKSAAAFSEVWDGQPIRRVRAGDGVSILPGRRLALHLMVQPDAASGFLADPMLRDQGLLSRILVAAPQSIAGTRFYREVRPEDDFAIKAYGARLLARLEAPLPLAEGKRNELDLPALEFSPEAAASWREFYNHVERQCGKGRDLATIQDFAAKVAEHAARIAGVLTVIEEEDPQEISAGAMEYALALSDWYLNEARRLQQAARLDPKLLVARRLLDWMRESGDEEFPFRRIVQFGPAPVRLKAAAEDALGILAAHGWISQAQGRPRRFRLHAAEA